MQRTLLALAATAALTSAATAQGYGYAYPRAAYTPQRMLSPDEVRDYQRDQVERRQEMERKALHMHQKAERRALGMDDD